MTFRNQINEDHMIRPSLVGIAFTLLLVACSTDPWTSRQQALEKIVSRESTGQGTAPVLDSIRFHELRERYLVVYPEFHFHANDGNVIALHRMLMSSDKPELALAIQPDAYVNISPDQQKRGATFIGGWHCGPEAYTATMKAFLADSNGNHSNTLDYVIRCSGD